MRREQLKRRLKAFGHGLKRKGDVLYITVSGAPDYELYIVAKISEKRVNHLSCASFGANTQEIPNEVFAYLTQYAMTPLAEREEEKRYFAQPKDSRYYIKKIDLTIDEETNLPIVTIKYTENKHEAQIYSEGFKAEINKLAEIEFIEEVSEGECHL